MHALANRTFERARSRESAMKYQTRIIATLMSLAISTPIFAQDVRRVPYQDRGFARRSLGAAERTSRDPYSYAWCLQSNLENALDCSYSSRAQCEATAAGGLGECAPNYSAR